MPNMKQVYDFAVKWCDKFREQNISYRELVSPSVGQDCTDLGFDVDGGQAFFEKYGSDASEYEALNIIIDDVNDIQLLGSAIYWRWIHFSQDINAREEILEYKNRAWFILALGRLALLCGKNPFIFEGTPKEIHIISNNIGYELFPMTFEEVEQHISIKDDGSVSFTAYSFGDGFGGYQKSRDKYFTIDKTKAELVLNTVAAYFSKEYEEVFATDIGNWKMELINTEGEVYRFQGSLCGDFEVYGVDLSDLIRDTLNMDDLIVFNGRCKRDIIDRITVDYHRVSKIKVEEDLEASDLEYVTWEYSEQLIIDRETQSIQHIQNLGTGCKVWRK